MASSRPCPVLASLGDFGTMWSPEQQNEDQNYLTELPEWKLVQEYDKEYNKDQIIQIFQRSSSMSSRIIETQKNRSPDRYYLAITLTNLNLINNCTNPANDYLQKYRKTRQMFF